MKRRRLLAALALTLLIAVFALAKWMTLWRPTKMAALARQPMPYTGDSGMIATQNTVLAGGDMNKWYSFDLKTNQIRLAPHEGLTTDDTLVRLKADEVEGARLILGAGAATNVYASPDFFLPQTYPTKNADNLEGDYLTAQQLRVSKPNNRVELVFGASYYRWNRTTRKIEHIQRFSNDFVPRDPWALARDSESVVNASVVDIRRYSTRTGKEIANFDLTKRRMSSFGVYLSPSGDTAFYLNLRKMSSPFMEVTCDLFDTRTGRLLWSASTSTNSVAVAFAADGKSIAHGSAGRWQIRDTQTGQIIRTLPLLPNTGTAAFSPDGATLYSVANGVLYRQRAR